jgi:L-ascorbate metabolism protein UlaG (beta-lactamase superfamily)
MSFRRYLVALIPLLIAGVVMTSYLSATNEDQRYINNSGANDAGFAKLPQILWQYLTNSNKERSPALPIPIQQLQLPPQATAQAVLYKISHSTVLLQLNGHYWLTDPVFSERASPVQWAGPKRFHHLPLQLSDIPALAGIILSHDHYDHLDKQSVLALNDRTERFIVPLGVDQHLISWGIPQEKIIALDWWQKTDLHGVTLTATPAQHFSGRSLSDKNKTLWASWAIRNDEFNLFFSGDSGYFSGFKTIGEKLGPFDLTLVETGAYNELWADIHMLPEQSLRAHLDLQGKHMIPIHNSSFDLAMHNWYEPLERLEIAARAYQVSLLTPVFGQGIYLDQLTKRDYQKRWWVELKLSAETQLEEVLRAE